METAVVVGVRSPGRIETLVTVSRWIKLKINAFNTIKSSEPMCICHQQPFSFSELGDKLVLIHDIHDILSCFILVFSLRIKIFCSS